MWYIYIYIKGIIQPLKGIKILAYATTQMNLKDIMLSE